MHDSFKVGARKPIHRWRQSCAHRSAERAKVGNRHRIYQPGNAEYCANRLAYPIDDISWEKIKSPLRTAGYDVRCIVLALPLEVALSERGGRQLSDWERARISVMYDEGYDNPSFANLVIDNSGEGANETAQRICDHLRLDGRGLN